MTTSPASSSNAPERPAEHSRVPDTARLWSLVNSTAELIQIVDVEGRITYTNATAERLLGYAPGELLGVNAFTLIHPDDLEETTRDFATLVQQGSDSVPVEARLRGHDGVWRWFELLGQNLLDDPLVGGLVISARNIDDRKRTEEQLLRQRSLLAGIAAASGLLLTVEPIERAVMQALETVARAVDTGFAGVFEFHDGDAEEPSVSRRFLWTAEGVEPPPHHQPYGMTPISELGLERWYAILRTGAELHTAVSSLPERERVRMERWGFLAMLVVPIFLQDALWGNITLADLKHERAWTDDEVTSLRSFATSVGEAIARHQSISALTVSERRFRSMLQSSSEFITVLDADHSIIFQSDAAGRVLGFPPGPFPRAVRQDLIHPADREPYMRAITAVAETPGSSAVVEYRSLNHEQRWLHLESVVTNHLDDPAVRGIVINSRDISERKQSEENLRRKSTVLAAVAEALAELLLTSDLNTGIQRALALMGEAAEVSRVTLYQFHADPLSGRQLGTKRNEWIAPGAEPRMHHPRVRDVPFQDGPFDYFFRELSAGRNVSAHVRLLPAPVRTALEQFVVKSICLVPLNVEDQLWGYLGFDAEQIEREWTLDDQAALRAAAGGVSAAIARQRAQQALEASGERFRAMVQNGSDIIVIFDAEDRVTYVSPSVERVLGWEPDEVVRRRRYDFVHPDEHTRTTELIRRLLQTPGASATLELRARHKDGSWRHVESVYTNLIDDPYIGGVVVNSRDITERRLLQEQLAWQAFHDPLTGLPNRLLFLDRLEQALQRADRRNEAVTIMFLDLDRFKVVNDSLGHATGDELLVTIGRRLEQCLRAGDTVARIGGDEFTILLDDLRRIDEATELADRILNQLRLPIRLPGGNEAFVTASIGIAVSTPQSPLSASDLLRSADVALYRAKDEGKARWTIFESEMNERAISRMRLETDLQRALSRGELRLYYQPEIELRSGALHAVEALLRWRSPSRALIQPAAFLEVAEETGLIVPIGRWALGEACRQLQAWQHAGLAPAELVMSVNLSASEFRQPDLAEFIEQVLIESELEPASLRLELTESVVLQDAQTAQCMLERLRALGVGVAIDDFGKGYSSLSYLSHLPVDTLKIDRAFIADPSGDLRSLAILEAVTTLAHALGMEVTAEGIETPEHLQRVLTAGCDFGQGFHFARPLAPAALADILLNGWDVDPAIGLPTTK